MMGENAEIPSKTLLKSARYDQKAFEELERQYMPSAIFKTLSSIVWIVQKKTVRKPTDPEVFAIKRQTIKEPLNLNDKAYRELRIFLRLRQMYDQHLTPNFVRIESWFKSAGPIKPFERILQAPSYSSSSSSFSSLLSSSSSSSSSMYF